MAIELVSDDLALFVISRVMITLERAASSIQLGKGHPPNLFNYYDLTVLKLPVTHTYLLTFINDFYTIQIYFRTKYWDYSFWCTFDAKN